MSIDWNSHRVAAQIENAEFLLDVARLPPHKVAERLGMTTEALRKMMGRHAEPDPDSE